MKRTAILLLLLSGAFYSCEKEAETEEAFQHKVVDTTIVSMQVFEYSFGYFGDEEGISIISYPGHSLSCEILNRQWEERILRYVPEELFIGTDTIVVETRRGSDGAGPSTEIDTTMLVIKVVEADH